MDVQSCCECGSVDSTLMVESSGNLFCGRCWRETLAEARRRWPSTPRLDAHIARVEQVERADAAGAHGG